MTSRTSCVNTDASGAAGTAAGAGVDAGAGAGATGAGGWCRGSMLSRYARIDIQSPKINPLLVVEVKNLCRARAERGASSL
mmetsp:Transcript_84628/g.123864  ORF Transcript_84628/g.123864 Transcript_84628/m.123864 type:complete len:81 (+) Transcript_84628:1241-1483(+)